MIRWRCPRCADYKDTIDDKRIVICYQCQEEMDIDIEDPIDPYRTEVFE